MLRMRSGLATAMLVLSASTQAAGPVGAMPAGPAPLYGVTLDAVDNVPAVVDALSHLSRTPTVRVVFDEGMDAPHYVGPVVAIRDVAYVMGELADSSTLKQYTAPQLRQRAAAYLHTLGSNVDVWEVGNEINGEWAGTSRDVVDKTMAAYEVIKAGGGRTALTLYYNEGCAEQPSRAMFDWVQHNLPPRLRDGQWLLATKNTLAYMARLEGILRLMPHARVVACVRHPLDTLASWKGTFSHLAEGDPSALPVGGLADPFLSAHLRDGLQGIVRLTDPAMRRAAWWRLLAAEILRWGERIEIVRYEDLIADPAAGMRQLLGPLTGVAGTPAEPLRPSLVRTARRQCLDEADWRAVAMLCGSVAEAFGYDCSRPDGVDAAVTQPTQQRTTP